MTINLTGKIKDVIDYMKKDKVMNKVMNKVVNKVINRIMKEITRGNSGYKREDIHGVRLNVYIGVLERC